MPVHITIPEMEGMYIASSFLINLCKITKCKYLYQDQLTTLCTNPVCFLAFHDIGNFKWEDMLHSKVAGCYCYSNTTVCDDCTLKNESRYKCTEVNTSYSEPMLMKKLHELLCLLVHLQFMPAALLFLQNLSKSNLESAIEEAKKDRQYLEIVNKPKEATYQLINDLFVNIQQGDEQIIRLIHIIFEAFNETK